MTIMNTYGSYANLDIRYSAGFLPLFCLDWVPYRNGQIMPFVNGVMDPRIRKAQKLWAGSRSEMITVQNCLKV